MNKVDNGRLVAISNKNMYMSVDEILSHCHLVIHS